MIVAERLASHFDDQFFDREEAMQVVNERQFNRVEASGLIFNSEWFDKRDRIS